MSIQPVDPAANLELVLSTEVTHACRFTPRSQSGFVSDETKIRIAEDITRIHSAVMKVPKSFVRVVFLSYPQRSGYTAGEEAPNAALNCVLRSGHTVEDKTELLTQLWSMFQKLTGIASEQLAISLQEIPSSNAMEMGQIMPGVSQE
jgi:phenylpyruvate tautomerase PptA (4-oxalocrotonate tautomerase family)